MLLSRMLNHVVPPKCLPLTDATAPTGKIHIFIKMAITFEPMMQF